MGILVVGGVVDIGRGCANVEKARCLFGCELRFSLEDG